MDPSNVLLFKNSLLKFYAIKKQKILNKIKQEKKDNSFKKT